MTDYYDAYFAQKPLIPAGQLHEIRFSSLERDPIAQVQTIYRTLKLSYSKKLDSRLRNYTQARRRYRKNVFSPLDHATKQQINREWRRSFSEWGYDVE